MIHGWSVSKSDVYLRAYRFSFQQLKVRREANLIRIKPRRFQKILDKQHSRLVAASAHAPNVNLEFEPLPNVRGAWAWSIMEFRAMSVAPTLRQIHLTKSNAEEISFVFR